MSLDRNADGQSIIEDLDEIYMAILPFIEVMTQYDARIDGKIAVMSFGDKKVTLGDLRKLEGAREKVFELARKIVELGAMERSDFLRAETAQWARPNHLSDFREFVERDILAAKPGASSATERNFRVPPSKQTKDKT